MSIHELDALDTIARSLATIAACLDEDRQRRRVSERTEQDFHRRAADKADANFRQADHAIARWNGVTDGDRQWHRDAEKAMLAAHDRLAAFEASHPWLLDVAVPA